MNDIKLYSPFILIEKVFGTFFIILSLIPAPFIGTIIQISFVVALANLGLVDAYAPVGASNVYIVLVAVILLICAIYIAIIKKSSSNYRLIWSIVRMVCYIFIVVFYGFNFF